MFTLIEHCDLLILFQHSSRNDLNKGGKYIAVVVRYYP